MPSVRRGVPLARWTPIVGLLGVGYGPRRSAFGSRLVVVSRHQWKADLRVGVRSAMSRPTRAMTARRKADIRDDASKRVGGGTPPDCRAEARDAACAKHCSWNLSSAGCARYAWDRLARVALPAQARQSPRSGQSCVPNQAEKIGALAPVQRCVGLGEALESRWMPRPSVRSNFRASSSQRIKEATPVESAH